MRHRRRSDEVRKLQSIENRAVQRSKQPGDVTHGTPTGSPSGSSYIPPACIGSSTREDENGNTIHGFILDQDRMDDPKVRLF